MLKLMKYEFRRQLFSKVIIFGGLLALVAAFFVFYLQGVEVGVRVILPLMAMATVIVAFYAPFEWSFTFEKDMNSKQGYMLFLVPKKSTTVLVAKMLVSFLQSIVIYGIFFTVVPFCERLYENKFGGEADYIGGIVNDFTGEMSVALLGVAVFLYVLGVFTNTVALGRGNVVAILGSVAYILAIFGFFFLLDTVGDLFAWLNAPKLVGDIFEWVYVIGIDVALFFGAAKLLDKKVSI
jgi:hypothetical protein